MRGWAYHQPGARRRIWPSHHDPRACAHARAHRGAKKAIAYATIEGRQPGAAGTSEPFKKLSFCVLGERSPYERVYSLRIRVCPDGCDNFLPLVKVLHILRSIDAYTMSGS